MANLDPVSGGLCSSFTVTGFLIAGTGSWGMACGLGNAAIVAQQAMGLPPSAIQIG
ncbi:hypothetical protein IQ241_23790 [Romeria aff. gracilis LEGE 07310]|uniref:Uncharacterized protein n=1 Tax=Vasconcelosia minhoensis LEGE 07310 TaxID=915328 RepID=A0A8J7DDV3_9CYAN|nr:hypothetical protein [Romeria gracilis]MBE9080272.1 hypothetical protein [Romeria aff. gracilis LEGE 07310]